MPDLNVGAPRLDYARRVDELGKIIVAYSDITLRLQESHEQLTATVRQLRAELGEKNRLLERRNRLAALGEMAAGLAHEIRNPLGGIQLYASLLARDVADRADSVERVRKISSGVKRVESIVGQVLQFTREVVAQPAQVDLVEIIAHAKDDAAMAMTERNIRCVVDGPAALPVRVDPLLIGQAILNLLLNAAEAIGRHGQIRIRFDRPAPDQDVRQFSLAVIDTGPGIKPEVLDRIFNPFFTTKESGTGLGLAIVHRIVEAHDGTITAANEPSGGARLEIRI